MSLPHDTAVPTVSIVTSHGRQTLAGARTDRVIDLLDHHGVPWSAVSVYVRSEPDGPLTLRPCLDKRLEELGDVSEVLLYFNRNVNPFLLSPAGFKTIEVADGHGAEATEYLYQRLDNESSSSETWLKKLSPEECRAIIADRVRDAVVATLPESADLVVGVSGGGDSNALLEGLARIEDLDLRIHPVIVMGIPDWDAGVPRAQELCDTYGLELTIIGEDDVKGLLGMPIDDIPLIDRFEREFKGDDFEFLGTLLIRLALMKRAAEVGTSFIATGLNLEDVLCEGMFRISTGAVPAGTPARTIGDVTLVFPLWLCPKRIIDGCFPKFSLDNYDARYPCFSLGRNLYYSLIYTIQSRFPGYVEQLAHGMSEMAAEHPTTYTYDEQLGFHVERFVPFPLRRKFERMLGRPTVAAN